MKKYITSIIMTLGVLITLSVLLYPTLADYVNSRNQSRVIAGYREEVANIDDGKKQEILEAARQYNARMWCRPGYSDFTEKEIEEYKKLLDTGSGIMGILTIDKIGVNLPIYHSTDEGVLQVGIGHMQGSHLPIGGPNTHAIITGHRGLPSSKLLTDLDKLVEGDVFTLYILGDTLTYQVDHIAIVEPHELSALSVEDGRDFCTLVTCTPYGVNTHRLLVRGTRIENIESAVREAIFADAVKLDKITIILMFIMPLLPVLLVYFVIKCVKIYKGRRIHR
ncbi:MAG: class C sortase [Oscillospiraceae bacterium]|nr:class C sortase [Oscillospiraceae bacterium]